MNVGKLKEAINILLADVDPETELTSIFEDADGLTKCYFNLEVLTDLEGTKEVIVHLTSKDDYAEADL